MMKRISIIKSLASAVIVLFTNLLFSQGFVETHLITNKLLIQKWNESHETFPLRASAITDTIELGPKGITDDFSYEGPYPDSSLWLDNRVFINRGYGIAPPTIGVATFDGLDANGYPYNFTASQTSTGAADELTSKPVNLNYPISDSIYFSFYYQPQGRGNSPEPADSLLLEFKNVGGWKRIWAKKGTSLFAGDSSWTLVMVPIKDPSFLIKGFQFRFRNYATLSGSLDHWSIDNVYLNRIRNQNDTTFEDISFVYDLPSLLNTYNAMPWKHYTASHMKSNYSTIIRNNHHTQKNTGFSYSIYDASGAQVNTTYSGGNINVDPFSPNGYLNYAPFTSPPLNYTIPVLSDTTEYTIKCVLNSTPDFNRKNDTLTHTQVFSNYYAYDDGSAESAFGLLGFTGSQMALKYTSTVTDTLRCIDIYFNPVVTDAELYTIYLKVWNDNGGKPGTAIYTSDTLIDPSYNQTGHDQFTRYYLKTPLNLGAGTFYIGFQQNTSQMVNIGVDKSINNQVNIFYNTTGTWQNSPNAGSLMMRPVFGPGAYFAGIKDRPTLDAVTLFPNPAHDKLHIQSNLKTESNIIYSIFDIYGRLITRDSSPIPGTIDISTLSEGVYFIHIRRNEQLFTIKFIKVN